MLIQINIYLKIRRYQNKQRLKKNIYWIILEKDVTSRVANEYTHPKNPKIIISYKMKASTELNNLLSISEYSHSDKDDIRHVITKDGWDYYTVNFKVDVQNFEGLIDIAKMVIEKFYMILQK